MFQDNCKPPKMLSNCGLPEDLMLNILFRLRASTLVNLKIVCKAWRALIESDSFIQKHLDEHMQKATERLIAYGLHSRDYMPRMHLLKALDNDGESSTDAGNAFGIRLPFPTSMFDKVVVEASCNGLLCLTIQSMPWIMLWNPTTGKSSRIRIPHTSLPFSAGMSYLPDTKDYKIVMIPREDILNNQEQAVWIYNVNSYHCKIVDMVFPYGPLQPDPSTSLKGFMHWLATGNHENLKIAAFDVAKDEFKYLALPSALNSVDARLGLKLVTFGGYFSAIAFAERRPPSDFSFEVWVMTEYGKDDTWNKLYKLSPFPVVAFPVGACRDGKLLFSCSEGNHMELLSYDPTTDLMKMFPPSKCMWLNVVNYVESLESVRENKNKKKLTGTKSKCNSNCDEASSSSSQAT